MLRGPKLLKTSVMAGFFGLAGVAAIATPAAAHSYTRCDWDGDHCVVMNCDWDGDECWQQSSYYRQPHYSGSGHWACDSDGDSCQWVYGRNDDWRDEDTPQYDPDGYQ